MKNSMPRFYDGHVEAMGGVPFSSDTNGAAAAPPDPGGASSLHARILVGLGIGLAFVLALIH